jgi:hypothetical protein
VTESRIQTLSVNCEPRYAKQGIDVYCLDTVPRNAFTKLPRIKLSIRQVPSTRVDDDEAVLADVLAFATDLEHLELSYDSELGRD